MDIQVALVDVANKLLGWAYSLILLVPNLVAATVVMLIAWGASRLVRGLIIKGMSRATSQVLLSNLMATIAQMLVMITGLFISLGILNLDKTVTSLLAGAGVIGLALAFAFQDIASNFLAGILLALRRPFSPGHIISTNDFLGTVEELNLRSTNLRTPEGQVVILPNASVFQKPITNFSMSGFRRVDVTCGVSYRDNLQTAKTQALAAVRGLEVADKNRPIDFYYTEFGESSINFTIRFWIVFSRQPDYLLARSQAIEAIKNSFDAASISIPFPIRTIELARIDGAAEQIGASPEMADGRRPAGGYR